MAALDRLRAICLELPEAVEKETWEIPTFRVRDKIFAMAHEVGTVWCGRAARGAGDFDGGGAGPVLLAALCWAQGLDWDQT